MEKKQSFLQSIKIFYNVRPANLPDTQKTVQKAVLWIC